MSSINFNGNSVNSSMKPALHACMRAHWSLKFQKNKQNQSSFAYIYFEKLAHHFMVNVVLRSTQKCRKAVHSFRTGNQIEESKCGWNDSSSSTSTSSWFTCSVSRQFFRLLNVKWKHAYEIKDLDTIQANGIQGKFPFHSSEIERHKNVCETIWLLWIECA